MKTTDNGLELKFCLGGDLQVADGTRVEGYASLFGLADQGGDIVQPGAYARSLERMAARGG